MMEKQELIIIEQLPVITERLKLISDEIDLKIAEAKALPVTDETIKTVKKMRAGLGNDFKAMEERRKAVKTAVLAPYDAFEEIYKQYVSSKYIAADNDLKVEIERNETARKNEKAAEVKEYFTEYALSKHNDIATWERAGIKVGLSDSMKSLREQAKAFVDRIESDLALIETQEYKEEVLVEYKHHLNVSAAITTVTARHKAIEEQKALQAESAAKKAAEAEAVKRIEAVVADISAPFAPPEIKAPVTDDPTKTLTFKVTAPVSKLRDLKKFLDDGGYRYE